LPTKTRCFWRHSKTYPLRSLRQIMKSQLRFIPFNIFRHLTNTEEAIINDIWGIYTGIRADNSCALYIGLYQALIFGNEWLSSCFQGCKYLFIRPVRPCFLYQSDNTGNVWSGHTRSVIYVISSRNRAKYTDTWCKNIWFYLPIYG